MNGLIVFLTISASLLIATIMKKDYVALLFLSLFIVPSINIGGYKSGLYFYTITYFVILIIKRRISVQFRSGIKGYLTTASFVVIISIFAWAMNNGNNLSGLIVTLLGSIKYILITIELCFLLKDYNTTLIRSGFDIAFRIVFLINAIALVAQITIPSIAAPFLDSIFQSESTTNQVYELSTSGLSRMTGIYYHPSIFAMFNLCSIGYFWWKRKDNKLNIIYVGLALVFGFLSATKTFILGIVVLLLLIALYSAYHLKNKGAVFSIISVVFLIMIVYVEYDNLFALIKQKNPNWAYYFSFLKNPLDAFSSRYGVKGSVTLSYEVIKQHPILGVGPLSMKGEFLGDSSPICLLHDCGIIGFVACVVLYLKTILNSLKRSNYFTYILLAIIFVSGFSLPVWMFYSFPFPVMFFAFLESETTDISTETAQI